MDKVLGGDAIPVVLPDRARANIISVGYAKSWAGYFELPRHEGVLTHAAYFPLTSIEPASPESAAPVAQPESPLSAFSSRSSC
jgi:hypothetical protein